MRTATFRLRANLRALALLVLLVNLPVGSLVTIGTAAPSLEGPACLRTLSVAEWEGSFTFSYSGTATERDGDYTSTAAVHTSASVTVRFITSDPYDPSDHQQD